MLSSTLASEASPITPSDRPAGPLRGPRSNLADRELVDIGDDRGRLAYTWCSSSGIPLAEDELQHSLGPLQLTRLFSRAVPRQWPDCSSPSIYPRRESRL